MHRRCGDLVGPNVVGVAVAAPGVVADHHPRPQLEQHLGQRVHGFDAGVDEGAWILRRRSARHAGVTPAACAAQETRRSRTQRGERPGEFQHPVATELVGAVGSQLRPLVADHFALFTEGAGHHRDRHPRRR